jgi:SAM-dependent methyltransferase
MPDRDRWRRVTRYDVDRERRRQEGTPYRDLLRTLRQRFLEAHERELLQTPGPIVEVGPGTGRYTRILTHHPGPLILVDVSKRMLRETFATLPPQPRPPDLLQGDAAVLPLRSRSVGWLQSLGGVLGFLGGEALRALEEMAEAVRPGGFLLLEVPTPLKKVPPEDWLRRWEGWQGPSGERFRGPASLISPDHWDTAVRESRPRRIFSPLDFPLVEGWVQETRWEVRDRLLVAPIFGSRPEILNEAIRHGEAEWARIIDLEESVGRDPRFRCVGGPFLYLLRRPAS